MTSSSLCRLRHKTQTNETGKGKKTWKGGGVRAIVECRCQGTSLSLELKREKEDVGPKVMVCEEVTLQEMDAPIAAKMKCLI